MTHLRRATNGPTRREVLDASRPARSRSLRRWWLDRSVRTKGLTVIAIPLLAMFCIISASLALDANERQQRHLGMLDRNIDDSASQILSDAVNGETGVRGYGVTRDSLFLAPYNLALARLGGDRKVFLVAALAEGSLGQQRTIDATTSSVFSELAALKAAIDLGASAGELTPALEAGKITMDSLRAQVSSVSAGPAAAFIVARRNTTDLETKISYLDITSFVIAFISALLGVALFTSGISSRVRDAADNADRLGEGRPLARGRPSRDELGRLADALARAETLLANRSIDITSARDDAIKATNAKNAFLSHTSHELRTPLNSILGFAQLLQLSDLNPEDSESSLRIIAAGRHLLALINDLIDIASIESGDLNISLERISVGPLVEAASNLLAPLAAQRSITISVGSANPNLAVHADQQRLAQVLVNLVANAVKYNRPGGTITISSQEEGGGSVSIRVTDTGMGIAEHDLERIFSPFERLGAELTAVEGTGIGLALSMTLTEAMGGRLTATSVLEEGSVFTVTLRRASDLVPAQPRLSESPRPAGSRLLGPPMHVLYVEDNPTNVEVISRYLDTRPHTRLTALASGRAAIVTATHDCPDVILLDLHLGEMQGEDVLTELRNDPVTARIPVVVLSADASPGVIRRLLARGALTYLTKPVDLAELGQVLDSVQGAGRAVHEHIGASTP